MYFAVSVGSNDVIKRHCGNVGNAVTVQLWTIDGSSGWSRWSNAPGKPPVAQAFSIADGKNGKNVVATFKLHTQL